MQNPILWTPHIAYPPPFFQILSSLLPIPYPSPPSQLVLLPCFFGFMGDNATFDRVFWIALRGREEWEDGKFAVGEFFLSSGWESDREWFWLFEPFLTLQKIFCEYWILNILKISMTCMHRVWSWNKNCKGAMTRAKNEVFIGLKHENC